MTLSVFACTPIAIPACSGDDTLAPLDAGTGADGSLPDVAVVADSSPDSAPTSCAFDAGPLDDAAVQLGASLVQSHGCYTCHGQSLSGNNDGVPSSSADGGVAYPPNLTSDLSTGLGCWTNTEIENAMLNGIDNEGMPLCSPMPLFGDIDGSAGLDLSSSQAIVAYLRSLPIVNNQVPETPECAAPSDAGEIEDAASDAADAADASADAADGS